RIRPPGPLPQLDGEGLMAHAYLGYRGDDGNTEYGGFFDPQMAALPAHVVDALHHGPQAEPVLLRLDSAATLLGVGYHQTENRYGPLANGAIQVSVRHDMTGGTPKKWHWWFGLPRHPTRR